MIGIIAAVSKNGIIGVDGQLPFDYPEDLSHFKSTTLNSTIIMGRKTFEGIGKSLPKRENFVITSTKLEAPGIVTFSSISSALEWVNTKEVWFCGGAGIYEEAMKYAETILLTITPNYINPNSGKVIRFPWINPDIFAIKNKSQINLKQTVHGIDALPLYRYERIF